MSGYSRAQRAADDYEHLRTRFGHDLSRSDSRGSACEDFRGREPREGQRRGFPPFSGSASPHIRHVSPPSPPYLRRRRGSSPPTHRSFSQSYRSDDGDSAYHSGDEEFQPRSRRRPPSPVYTSRHSSRRSSPPPASPRRGRSPSPPPRQRRRSPSPAPRSRRRSPSPHCSSPRSVFVDENPDCLYTYDDEEPDEIPMAPDAWNNHQSSATREQLIEYFTRNGYSRAIVEREVGKEFESHASTHRAGESRAGPSRAEARSAYERERGSGGRSRSGTSREEDR